MRRRRRRTGATQGCICATRPLVTSTPGLHCGKRREAPLFNDKPPLIKGSTIHRARYKKLKTDTTM
eukprot:3626826-Pyramimonas_sp.AAC.1